MNPQRMLQIALGVPDAIAPERRWNRAARILIQRCVANSTWRESAFHGRAELEATASVCLDAVEAAHAAGDLDDVLCSVPDAELQIVDTVLRRLNRSGLPNGDPSGVRQFTNEAVAALVTWSNQHPVHAPTLG